MRFAALRHSAPNPSRSPSVPVATSTTMTPCRNADATIEIAIGTSITSRKPPTLPAVSVSRSSAAAFSMREKVKMRNGTTTAAVAIAETSCTTRPLPNVAAGLRRSAVNGAQSRVPKPSGRNGSSPGLGGGAQAPGAPGGGGGGGAPYGASDDPPPGCDPDPGVGAGAPAGEPAPGRGPGEGAPPGACQS